MKNGDGEYILLVLNPEDGDDLTEENINSLIPIIKKYCNEFKNDFDDISILNGTIIFNSSNVNNILSIVNICKKEISERVIVPQIAEQGPAIRHRPLYFGLNNDDNGISIKFTELGNFNNFERALDILN